MAEQARKTKCLYSGSRHFKNQHCLQFVTPSSLVDYQMKHCTAIGMCYNGGNLINPRSVCNGAIRVILARE